MSDVSPYQSDPYLSAGADAQAYPPAQDGYYGAGYPGAQPDPYGSPWPIWAGHVLGWLLRSASY